MNARRLLLALGLVVTACGAGAEDVPLNSRGADELGGVDGGSPSSGADQLPCARLEARACGLPEEGVPCDKHAQCDAARTLGRHGAEETCEAELADGGTFPACADVVRCDELVTRCCGVTGACADEAACLRAREIELQQDEVMCAQSIRDEASFPRCGRQ